MKANTILLIHVLQRNKKVGIDKNTIHTTHGDGDGIVGYLVVKL